MSWLNSLLITSAYGAGVALVIWLVSMIAGDTGVWMVGVLTAVFAIVWFWVHMGINDPELGNRHHLK